MTKQPEALREAIASLFIDESAEFEHKLDQIMQLFHEAILAKVIDVDMGNIWCEGMRKLKAEQRQALKQLYEGG